MDRRRHSSEVTWQSERVEGSSRRVTLRSLTSEIDFAFRNPAPLDPASSADPEELLSTPDVNQAGDYLDALRFDARRRGVNALQVARPVRPPSHPRAKRQRSDAAEGDAALDHLVWDVNDVRQEIQQLREIKRVLETQRVYRSIHTRDAVFGVTRAYFEVFEGGFRLESGKTQTDFLRSVVDPDVITCSKMCGIDALIDQWKRYTLYFHLHSYKLHSLRATALDAKPIVQITCSFKVKVSISTVAQLFPHVLSDSFLLQMIVGREITCDSRAMFLFDEHNRILRYDDDSDFLTAFGKLLRNPRELATLMCGALIQEQSLIGELELPTRSLMPPLI